MTSFSGSFGHYLADQKYGYFGIAALIIGVLLGGLSLVGIQESLYWKEYGVATNGTVLEKYVKEECQSGGSNNTRTCINNYHVTYRYSPDGLLFLKGDDSINDSDWKSLDIGSNVSLLYSSAEPRKSSVSYVHDGGTKLLIWQLIFGIGVLAILAGLLVTYRFYAAWKNS